MGAVCGAASTGGLGEIGRRFREVCGTPGSLRDGSLRDTWKFAGQFAGHPGQDSLRDTQGSLRDTQDGTVCGTPKHQFAGHPRGTVCGTPKGEFEVCGSLRDTQG